MAHLTLTLDLGQGARLGTLAKVLEDLTVLQGLAFRLDMIAARREAALRVERWWSDSPGQLRETASALDESTAADIHQLVDARQILDSSRDELMYLLDIPRYFRAKEWSMFLARFPSRAGRLLQQSGMVAYPLQIPRLEAVAPDLHEALVASETARLQPPLPSVERLTYENPFEIVIFIALLGFAEMKYGYFRDLLMTACNRRDSRARESAVTEVVNQAGRLLGAWADEAELKASMKSRLAEHVSRPDDIEEADTTGNEVASYTSVSDSGFECNFDDSDDR